MTLLGMTGLFGCDRAAYGQNQRQGECHGFHFHLNYS